MAQLQIGDGRKLHYETSTAVRPGAAALVFHHGQPGAALLLPELVAAAESQGWGVVMLSRPGYGHSDRQLGRTVVDAAADVKAVLDHLGVGRFVTAGWSGGGPHALACGALLAPRCAAVATIAGVAPYEGAADLDFTDGMGPENVAEFEAFLSGDADLEGRIIETCAELAVVRADQLINVLGGLLSEPDKESIEGDFAEWTAALMRLSAINGHYGYWDDDQAFFSSWGFDLGQMEVPVRVWRGDEDLMVPASHGIWLADHIRGAKGFLVAGEGHMSLLRRHLGSVVAGLAIDAGNL